MGNGSFIPSINVDSCIIEEQEDHLVIAIRVPKATVAANLAMFVAMADRCGADDPRVWSTRSDPPPAQPIRQRGWSHAALILAAAMVSIVALPPIAWSAGHTLIEHIHHIF